MVHAGLAADGGIHHRQQGGGHLHHGDAPQPGGGGEAGHVAHHAAAEGHDQRSPLQAVAEGGVMDQGHGGGGFLVFAGFDHQGVHREASLLEAAATRGPVVPLDLGIGDQQHPGVRPDSLGHEQFCQAGQAACSEHDRVGLGRQGNRDGCWVLDHSHGVPCSDQRRV